MSKSDAAPVRPARLQEVALRARVAPITVSRAIRTPEKVSPAARQRIHQAIEEIGYVPNRVAGSLASNRTNLVAALVPNIGNPLFARTIQGLTEVLREHRLHVTIGNTGHSNEEEAALIEAFLAQRVCGIVLHHTTHNPRARKLLAESGVCVVETGDLVRRPLGYNVSYSSFAAAKALTLHALQCGYRRIAYVSSQALERTKARRRGYRAALAEYGLADDPALLIDLPHNYESGVRAVELIAGLDPRPDCALFSGIATAVAAGIECQRRGLHVPRDLALATFDDNELAQLVSPPLTALQLPRLEIGRRAGRIIAARLALGSGGPSQVDLGYTVVRRGST